MDWQNIKMIRPATHPANEKMLDSLFTKTSFSENDREQLAKILDNYISN